MLINKFASLQEASSYLANALQQDINMQIEKNGKSLLIMPGGNSIKRFFSAISEINAPWSKVTFSLSDERCVPVDHSMSNERQLREELLNKLPNYNYHPLNNELILMFKVDRPLTILSMGTDGHVASLFPEEANYWKNLGIEIFETVNQNPKRISLSEKAIMFSQKIYMLVLGSQKNYLFNKMHSEKAFVSSAFNQATIISIEGHDV